MIVENYQDNYSFKMKWDPEHFSSVLMWLSNKGREEYPWNGEHTTLGLEPITSTFGLSTHMSNNPKNPINTKGVKTTIQFKKDTEWNKWTHIFDNVSCKHISVFISVDGIGDQAEYIRDGLDWEKLKHNVDRLLTETSRVSITFINTFNLLSIPSLNGFLDYILELRKKFGYQYQVDNNHKVLAQKIWFDTPYMREPNWFNIQLCDNDLLDTIQENIDYMKTKVLPDMEYGFTYQGFKNYEILKLERDLAWAKEGENMHDEELSDRVIRFYQYFSQYDKRRGFNFLETFPELVDFMREAKEEYEEKYAP